MAVYRVTPVAREIYEVEADDEREAIEWAYERLNQDPFCFETSYVEVEDVEWINF